MKNSPEHQGKKEVSREEALAAYKKFIERGITKPDALDLNDPEVKEANSLFYAWQKQVDKKAGKDKAAQFRAQLLKSNFYLDAGFKDRSYLIDVRKWNVLGKDDVAKAIGRSKKPDLLKEIQREYQRKIAKINKLLENDPHANDALRAVRQKIGNILAKAEFTVPPDMPEITPEETRLIMALRKTGPHVEPTKSMHKKWVDEEWAKIPKAKDRVEAGIMHNRRRAVLYMNAGDSEAAIKAWHAARHIAEQTRRMELSSLIVKEMRDFLGQV